MKRQILPLYCLHVLKIETFHDRPQNGLSDLTYKMYICFGLEDCLVTAIKWPFLSFMIDFCISSLILSLELKPIFPREHRKHGHFSFEYNQINILPLSSSNSTSLDFLKTHSHLVLFHPYFYSVIPQFLSLFEKSHSPFLLQRLYFTSSLLYLLVFLLTFFSLVVG